MGRAGLTAAGALVLIGCIPQADPPLRAAAPVQRYDPPYTYDDPPPPRRRDPASTRPHEDSARSYDAPADDVPPRRRPSEPRRTDPAPRPDPAATEPPVAALPAPRPAWEARPVAPDAAAIGAATVVVRPGDTLSRIAERAGASAEVIARENGVAPPFVVRAGQRLRVPAGRYHLVRPGQSGIAIARAYGVEWSRIVSANALAEPYVLRAGQRVLIPELWAGTRAADRAAAFRLDVDDILTGGEPALAANAAPARPVATPRRVLPVTAAVVPPAAAPGLFAWPVRGRVVTRFGPGRSGERSNGIKIAVPQDTPVLATADGTVAYVGDGIAALGGLVIVKHGGGWTSVYGHAAKLLVRRGQAVKRGQALALSGDTGFADRPELHFELRRGRVPVDPQSELPRL